jgi:hypothetical protein
MGYIKKLDVISKISRIQSAASNSSSSENSNPGKARVSSHFFLQL